METTSNPSQQQSFVFLPHLPEASCLNILELWLRFTSPLMEDSLVEPVDLGWAVESPSSPKMCRLLCVFLETGRIAVSRDRFSDGSVIAQGPTGTKLLVERHLEFDPVVKYGPRTPQNHR